MIRPILSYSCLCALLATCSACALLDALSDSPDAPDASADVVDQDTNQMDAAEDVADVSTTDVADNDASPDIEDITTPDTIEPDDTCSEITLSTTALAPNLYFLLQDSGAMAGKYAIPNVFKMLFSGIILFLNSYESSDFNAGLMLFPGKSDIEDRTCSVGGTEYVPMQPLNAPAFEGVTDSEDFELTGPAALAPALTQIQNAHLLSVDGDRDAPARRTALIIFTDAAYDWPGPAECPLDDSIAQAIEEIENLKEQGIEIHVVGVLGAFDKLEALAAAAGTELRFQGQNDEPDSVAQSIAGIYEETMGCVYKLDPKPEETQAIQVEINGTPIADTQYDYDSSLNILTLSSRACTTLKNATTRDPLAVNLDTCSN